MLSSAKVNFKGILLDQAFLSTASSTPIHQIIVLNLQYEFITQL
jgi:hypothetical protein